MVGIKNSQSLEINFLSSHPSFTMTSLCDLGHISQYIYVSISPSVELGVGWRWGIK